MYVHSCTLVGAADNRCKHHCRPPKYADVAQPSIDMCCKVSGDGILLALATADCKSVLRVIELGCQSRMDILPLNMIWDGDLG